MLLMCFAAVVLLAVLVSSLAGRTILDRSAPVTCISVSWPLSSPSVS